MEDRDRIIWHTTDALEQDIALITARIRLEDLIGFYTMEMMSLISI
jgi:hypothetical protein